MDSPYQYKKNVVLPTTIGPCTWLYPTSNKGWCRAQHASSSKFVHVHTLGADSRKLHQICTSVPLQPKTFQLLKAIHNGFLKGYPKKWSWSILIQAPATAKGHMKHPRHGIWSTQWVQPGCSCYHSHARFVVPAAPQAPGFHANWDWMWSSGQWPATYHHCWQWRWIISKRFLLWHVCQQNSRRHVQWPHWELPVYVVWWKHLFHSSLPLLCKCHISHPYRRPQHITIFNANKDTFTNLSAKGFKPKLNVMDDQAKKHIKKFLTKENCKLQLVDPHNHPMNVAER